MSVTSRPAGTAIDLIFMKTGTCLVVILLLPTYPFLEVALMDLLKPCMSMIMRDRGRETVDVVNERNWNTYTHVFVCQSLQL